MLFAITPYRSILSSSYQALDRLMGTTQHHHFQWNQTSLTSSSSSWVRFGASSTVACIARFPNPSGRPRQESVPPSFRLKNRCSNKNHSLLSRRMLLHGTVWLSWVVLLADGAMAADASLVSAPQASSSGTHTGSLTGTSTALFRRAKDLAERGHLDDAMKAYSELVDREPQFPAAFSNRGNLFVIRGCYPEALHDYNRAVDLLTRPTMGTDVPVGGQRLRELWVLYLNRGTVHRQLGNRREALEDFMAALDIRPLEPAVLVNRAMLYVDEQKYDAALLDYQRAIEQRANEVEPFWLDYALTLYERGRTSDALGILRRMSSKPEFRDTDEVKAALTVILFDRGSVFDAERIWATVQRPKRFRDERFLKNERRWPPRAIEAVTHFQPRPLVPPSAPMS